MAAAAEGLEVWFSPFPVEVPAADLISQFRDCAGRAERLRREGAAVVLVIGCELSLFNPGYLPGTFFYDRIRRLAWPTPRQLVAFARLPKRLNAFLADAAAVARAEFGCCADAGAADRGGLGWDIADYDEAGLPTIRGEYERDEAEQVRYLQEVNQIFVEEGLDLAFWFTFAKYHMPASPDPRLDADLASHGLVCVLPEGPGSGYQGLGWRPRQAFDALAALPTSEPQGRSGGLI